MMRIRLVAIFLIISCTTLHVLAKDSKGVVSCNGLPCGAMIRGYGYHPISYVVNSNSALSYSSDSDFEIILDGLSHVDSIANNATNNIAIDTIYTCDIANFGYDVCGYHIIVQAQEKSATFASISYSTRSSWKITCGNLALSLPVLKVNVATNSIGPIYKSFIVVSIVKEWKSYNYGMRLEY